MDNLEVCLPGVAFHHMDFCGIESLQVGDVGRLFGELVDDPLRARKGSPGALHHVYEGGLMLNLICHCQATGILPLRVTVELQVGPVV